MSFLRAPAPLAALFVSGFVLAAAASSESPSKPSPSPTAAEAAPVEDPPRELNGRDIYECVLENRFGSYEQVSRLVSGDRGDASQESRLRMIWKDWRDADKQPRRGILSKTLVKYTHPFDLRFSGYLIVANDSRRADQFVYLNGSRRIRRVSLRREAVFGTDFSFEDIVPDELEDADYQRLEDARIGEIPVYRVQVVPKPHANSEYSRFIVSVEKDRCVPLLTRYWDEREIEVKELTASPTSVKQYGGIHVATEATMRNLRLETFTTLFVESLEPDKTLSDRAFDIRRLEAH